MSKYKFSDYLTVVTRKDECLLAQGYMGQLQTMKKKLFNEVVKHLNRKGSPEIEKEKERLIGMLMILPEGLDEQIMVKGRFNYSARQKKKFCGLILILTLRCNFACSYCYEDEERIDMKKEIVDKALKALFAKAKRVKPEMLRIEFYGGEPLLNFGMLEYAVREIRAFCQKNGIQPAFNITTNGSIFNQKIAQIFSGAKDLRRVQITLDGPREMHDCRRMFKGGRGSYEVIMENIPRWMKIAQILHIRINVDRENVQHIPTLLRELRKWRKEKIAVYFNEVVEGWGRAKGRKQALDLCDYKVLESRFHSLARKLGLPVRKAGRLDFRPILCTASTADPDWVGPDGEIYCCPQEMNDRSLSVGNIFSGYDKRKAKDWINYNVLHIEKCLKCRHIFFCGGPCPFKARKGMTDTHFCGEGFRRFLKKNFQKISRQLGAIQQERNAATV